MISNLFIYISLLFICLYTSYGLQDNGVIYITGLGVSKFNRMVRAELPPLMELYPNLDFEWLTMDGNTGPTNNVTKVMEYVGNSSKKIVLWTNSNIRVEWPQQAALTKNTGKVWVVNRGPPLTFGPILNNTMYHTYNEASMSYIKGVAAAEMHQHYRETGVIAEDHHDYVIVIQGTFVTVYTNYVNFFLAGLKSVDPDAKLFVVNPNSPGGGTLATVCNVSGLPHEELTFRLITKIEQERGTYFPLLTVFQSFLNWPIIAARENRSIIDDQMGYYSPESDYDAMLGGPTGHPEVLFMVLWNHIPIWQQILDEILDNEFLSGVLEHTSVSKSGEKVLSLSRLSPLIPNIIQKKLIKLEKKLITQEDKNAILCDEATVSLLKTVYPVVNKCIDPISVLFIREIITRPDVFRYDYTSNTIC